jgi:hypothetical protein
VAWPEVLQRLSPHGEQRTAYLLKRPEYQHRTDEVVRCRPIAPQRDAEDVECVVRSSELRERLGISGLHDRCVFVIEQQVDVLILRYRPPRYAFTVAHGTQSLLGIQIVKPDVRIDAVALRPDQDAHRIEFFRRSKYADAHRTVT